MKEKASENQRRERPLRVMDSVWAIGRSEPFAGKRTPLWIAAALRTDGDEQKVRFATGIVDAQQRAIAEMETLLASM
ncbi:MAG TPA: hypothetical protein VF055_11340 [Steroidobacteraceae bacterium]